MKFNWCSKIFKKLTDEKSYEVCLEEPSETTLERIPLPSVEAFSILLETRSDIVIKSFIYHFNNLINTESSVLIDLKSNPPLINTKQFVTELNDTANRLLNALSNQSPYKYLYGDLLKFQGQLQVVLSYYRDQIESGQPIANRYLSGQDKNLARSPYLLDEKNSPIIQKYTINKCANSIMEEQSNEITKFILRSFLEDHSQDVGFSYLRHNH